MGVGQAKRMCHRYGVSRLEPNETEKEESRHGKYRQPSGGLPWREPKAGFQAGVGVSRKRARVLVRTGKTGEMTGMAGPN